MKKTCLLLIALLAVPQFLEAQQAALPLSPESSGDIRHLTDTRIFWEGIEYERTEAIRILRQTILSNQAVSVQRVRALDRLASLGTLLNNQEWLDELVKLYAQTGVREERIGILMCFVKSRDKRGPILLADVVKNEKDPFFRLLAAGGLAQWNVRSGVEELVKLFRSKEQLSNGRTIGDEAAIWFRSLNTSKEWGFPERDVRMSLADTDLENDSILLDKWFEYWDKWWSANIDRFPDWKPGDPLPEVEAPQEPREAPDTKPER